MSTKKQIDAALQGQKPKLADIFKLNPDAQKKTMWACVEQCPHGAACNDAFPAGVKPKYCLIDGNDAFWQEVSERK